jgi:uncharacterized protein (TIGR03435 family)
MGQMHADDMDLVRDFAANGSEAAFATLVGRHVNLVYSAALRRLGNSHEVEEVAQAVFIILARKAGSLRRGTILSGWLYQTAQLTAANFHRAALRRRRREQEAFMQFSEQSQPDVSWHRLSPLLEEAMMRLGPKERDAVVLRFFENRTVREVASALGLREDTAQKRVNRATDKLRDYFVRRGVQVSTAALLASIGTHAVQAAPVELGSKIAATAALKGAAGSGSMLTLIKTTLKLMAWTKAKTAIVIGASVLLAVGTTTVTVKEIQHYRTPDWQLADTSFETLSKAPRQTAILPTKSAQRSRRQGNGGMVWSADGRVLGINQTVKTMLVRAYMPYGADSQCRIVLNTILPEEKYDFLANLPAGSSEAVQQALKEKFGLVGRLEKRDTDVLLLKVRRNSAPGLRPSTATTEGMNVGYGYISVTGEIVSSLLPNIEERLEVPVLDRTGLTGRYDISLSWRESGPVHTNPEALKQALLDQLGLELVPSREPIEMWWWRKCHSS